VRGSALAPAPPRPSPLPRAVAVVGAVVGELLAAAGILSAAAFLRLWSIGTRPGFDWDEPVYAAVGRSVAGGHGIYAKPSFGVDQGLYLFHPPFHFELLGAWFALAGAGIAQARVLTALASLVTLALLYVLLRRRWGAWALGPAAVLATDGWLVFTNRVSWIENVMMVLAVGGLVVYDQALRSGRLRSFAVAGALLGGAAVYKHVGIYVLVAVLAHWVLVRRRQRREHVILALAAGGVIVAYISGAILLTLSHGSSAFLADSGVQLQRLTGHKASRGSIGGGATLGALTGPYKVFALTLALSAAGGALVAWRGAQALRRRSMAAIPDPLLFCWAASALVCFAALKLKMGHYFMMVELPLLLVLAAELRPRLRDRRRLALGLLAVVLAANMMTFTLRFVDRHDNALGAVAAYAASDLPPHALVLTEESVGSIIGQPYCKLTKVSACADRARYLMIYRSLTQAPPAISQLDGLLRYATPLRTFTGFKERITVYRAPAAGPVCAADRVARGFCAAPSGTLLAATRGLRRPGTRAAVRFGRYDALRAAPALRPLQALPSAAAPAVVLLGVGKAGTAVFFNTGRARVSGASRCRPSPAQCREITLRPRGSAHLELPTVAGGRIAYELKLDPPRPRSARRSR
jgi:4-amino-4-deoxy-L-arabinose transferase-like glycosyltransferase